MTKPQDLNPDQRALYDVWRSLGLSEQSAMNALREDGQLEVSGFDAATDMFRNVFGLSESGARVAAEGRNFSDFGGSSAGGRRDPFVAAEEALARMSDAECDAVWAEEQRRRKSAKKAAAAKPDGKRTTTISETSRRGR